MAGISEFRAFCLGNTFKQRFILIGWAALHINHVEYENRNQFAPGWSFVCAAPLPNTTARVSVSLGSVSVSSASPQVIISSVSSPWMGCWCFLSRRVMVSDASCRASCCPARWATASAQTPSSPSPPHGRWSATGQTHALPSALHLQSLDICPILRLIPIEDIYQMQ